jgi:hypothetical protein
VDMSATNPTESWASEFGRASAATSTEDDLVGT